MIFLQLFLIFSKIGIVGFGGGYAMLSLIQDDVVTKEGWLSAAEFTDIVAVSQMTPGPLGINMATYVGYTSVLNAGYPPAIAMLGSFITTLSIIWLPFLLMLGVSHLLLKHKDSPIIKGIFSGLRPTIVGLVAAAALVLMNAAGHTLGIDGRRRHEDRRYPISPAFISNLPQETNGNGRGRSGTKIIDASHDDEKARLKGEDIRLEAVGHRRRSIPAEPDIFHRYRRVGLPIVQSSARRRRNSPAAMGDTVA